MHHGDHMGIGRGQHGRNFTAREKRKKANVGNIRGSQLKALALSTVAYEHEADVFSGQLPGAF